MKFFDLNGCKLYQYSDRTSTNCEFYLFIFGMVVSMYLTISVYNTLNYGCIGNAQPAIIRFIINVLWISNFSNIYHNCVCISIGCTIVLNQCIDTYLPFINAWIYFGTTWISASGSDFIEHNKTKYSFVISILILGE